MSCPNCGATLSRPSMELSDDRVQTDDGLLATVRWSYWRCEGLVFRTVPEATPEPLSPPCGWFRWDADYRTERSTFSRVPPGYSQPEVEPGQSFAWDDLTDEQREHVRRVAEYVRSIVDEP